MALKKFSIKQDISKFYHDNGYVVLHDLFSIEEVNLIKTDILEQYSEYFKFSDKNFETGQFLIEPYEKNKEQWKYCAKRMQNSIRNMNAASKPEVVQVLKKIGLKSPITWVMPESRIDMPYDEQYRQPWHQDWRSGQGSLNSVTIWLPLHKVERKHGAIEIIEKSHIEGYKEVEVINEPLRYIMNPLPENIDKAVTIELDESECVIFSQLLVHRSGINNSNVPRMTSQFRYSDRTDDFFKSIDFERSDNNLILAKKTPTKKMMLNYLEKIKNS